MVATCNARISLNASLASCYRPVDYDGQVIRWTAGIRNYLEYFMDNNFIFSVENSHYEEQPQ